MSEWRREGKGQNPAGGTAADRPLVAADRPPAALRKAARRRLQRVLGSLPSRWLLVDVARQRLHLYRVDAPPLSWPISTAAAGIDGREDSGGTPPGVLVVAEKIGASQAAGDVFRSRQPTGEHWQPGGPLQEEDLVLSRILVLDGCEDGINRGPGCDSRARYIYIHGTNHEDRLGEAISHGCIRLGNADVIDLFALVQEGDALVVI
jgi:hypothetical protein